MNKSPSPGFLFICILLLVGASVCFLGAGVYAFVQPRLYSAATGFQLLLPGADTPRLQDAFQKAKQQFPSRMQQPLTARTKLEPSGTQDQYYITAIDASPLTAADTANMLTLLVRDS